MRASAAVRLLSCPRECYTPCLPEWSRCQMPGLPRTGSRWCRAVHTCWCVEELLNQIGQNLTATAVEVNTVAMKLPTVESPDLIVALAQDKLPEHVAIEWQEVEPGERAARR